jgi:DNA-directed RNA polymerase specialized sigma24 family protein
MSTEHPKVPVLSPKPEDAMMALDPHSRILKAAPRQAQVVELRYFGGLSVEKIAEVMKLSTRSIERDWQFASASGSRQHRPGEA